MSIELISKALRSEIGNKYLRSFISANEKADRFPYCNISKLNLNEDQIKKITDYKLYSENVFLKIINKLIDFPFLNYLYSLDCKYRSIANIYETFGDIFTPDKEEYVEYESLITGTIQHAKYEIDLEIYTGVEHINPERMYENNFSFDYPLTMCFLYPKIKISDIILGTEFYITDRVYNNYVLKETFSYEATYPIPVIQIFKSGIEKRTLNIPPIICNNTMSFLKIMGFSNSFIKKYNFNKSGININPKNINAIFKMLGLMNDDINIFTKYNKKIIINVNKNNIKNIEITI